MGVWNEFYLLLYKNTKLQLRKIKTTIAEIIVPIALSLLLLWIRTLVTSTVESNPTVFETQMIGNHSLDAIVQGIAYTPKTLLTDSIVAAVATKMKFSKSKGFGSESDMQRFLLASDDKTNIPNLNVYLGGIVFDTSRSDWNSVPHNITYTLRFQYNLRKNTPSLDKWDTDRLFPRFSLPGPRGGNKTDMSDPDYAGQGFLPLQYNLHRAIAESIDPTSSSRTTNWTLPEVVIQKFPYPPYNNDPFLLAVQQQFPFIMIMAFIFMSLMIPKEVVLEKEQKLKEAMKMMGMSGWLQWSAWFIRYFSILFFTTLIMAFIFVTPGSGQRLSILINSDMSVVWVFLLLYVISIIAFAFMISTFFNKANAAAAAGGILYFLSYMPYIFISRDYDSLTSSVKLAFCILNNQAMSLGMLLLGKWESTGVGVQWNNIWDPVNRDDEMCIGYVFMFLLGDSILYMLIAGYVEAVKPGEYGSPQPLWFFVLPSYWCGTRQSTLDDKFEMERDPEFFEDEPIGAKAGIQIRGLTKKFKSKGTVKAAVNNLALNMYENQITALLGHNGAGKTTTMFMLTGFIPPSSGTALVNGYDIKKDLSNVRSSLGLCPQHDILFDEMTVEEHLYIFARLKGCRGEKLTSEIDYYIKTLGLEDKRKANSSTLSGGMKRKLSVGIALIGDSKVVILDEPTSGMDPSARRFMWDVLQSQRNGRTIILSTHFMDEADALGDRIAIMADGVVQCCGTSLFLKKKYGAGYHLVLTKKESCNVQNVTKLIMTMIPEATLEGNIGAELSFVLPNESVSAFPDLFSKLEKDKDALGVLGFGASITTMEEVFMKVGEDHGAVGDEAVDEELKGRYSYNNLSEDELSQIDIPRLEGDPTEKSEKYEKNKGLALTFQQFKAMVIKRMLYTVRNKILTLSQVFMPVFFTILTVIIMSNRPSSDDVTKLTLSLDTYGANKVVYNDLYNNSVEVGNISKTYRDLLSGTEHTLIPSTDVEETILLKGEDSLKEYRLAMGVALDLVAPDETVIAYYNQGPLHTSPISLLLTDTALIQTTINSSYSFHAYNHPLPQSASAKTTQAVSSPFDPDSFAYSTNLMFGFSFLAASFVVFLIQERVRNIKHCQIVSGVKWYTFWMSTYAWDIVTFMIPSLLVAVVFAIGQVDAYADVSNGNIQPVYVILLMFIYGITLLPTMYVTQFLFSGAASGYVFLVFYNVLTGIVPSITVLILQAVLESDQKYIADTLEVVFTALLPSYNFGAGLGNIYTNYGALDLCFNKLPEALMNDTGRAILDEICDNLERFKKFAPDRVPDLPCCKFHPDLCGSNGCVEWQENYLSWNKLGMGQSLIFMMIQLTVYWAILIVIETDIIRKLFYKCRPKVFITPQSSEVADDEDVLAEKTKILYNEELMARENNPVVISGLTKFFGNHKAVDDIYLSIPAGETFGLLGVNGAGKTTTFRMLTGDETISGGTAYMNGFNIKTDIHQVQKSIGYCPQFDALVDQMTGEEILYMYCRLRGIPEQFIAATVQNLIKALLLEKHYKKQSQTYSGGNKRKLSTAIALVGNPPIVFLDEPTTGMDPVARRMLWGALSRVRDSGKTLILTSHSMEECEALCTRMAIMVNGKYRCMGATQHLKNKFGSGYTLVTKVSYSADGGLPDLEKVEKFVSENFPNSVLKDKHQNLLQYHISKGGMGWAEIFGKLEENKETLNIEDYSVSQTTLEQVFINFARTQIEPDETKRGCTTRMRQNCCIACLPEYVIDPNLVAPSRATSSPIEDKDDTGHSQVNLVRSNSGETNGSIKRGRSGSKVAPGEEPV